MGLCGTDICQSILIRIFHHFTFPDGRELISPSCFVLIILRGGKRNVERLGTSDGKCREYSIIDGKRRSCLTAYMGQMITTVKSVSPNLFQVFGQNHFLQVLTILEGIFPNDLDIISYGQIPKRVVSFEDSLVNSRYHVGDVFNLNGRWDRNFLGITCRLYQYGCLRRCSTAVGHSIFISKLLYLTLKERCEVTPSLSVLILGCRVLGHIDGGCITAEDILTDLEGIIESADNIQDAITFIKSVIVYLGKT